MSLRLAVTAARYAERTFSCVRPGYAIRQLQGRLRPSARPAAPLCARWSAPRDAAPVVFALIRGQRPQEFRQVLAWHGLVMRLPPGGLERALKVNRRVPVCPARDDAVSEDLADRLL